MRQWSKIEAKFRNFYLPPVKLQEGLAKCPNEENKFNLGPSSDMRPFAEAPLRGL